MIDYRNNVNQRFKEERGVKAKITKSVVSQQIFI